jgi:uncharacterized protein
MRLLPREEKFYELLVKQTEVIQQASNALLDGVRQGGSHLKTMAPRISQLEEEGDVILHDVFTRLNQTFITPIDPEDIHSLCSYLDDVLDGIEDASHCIVAYKIDPIPPEVVAVCEVLQKSAVQLNKAMEALEGDRNIMEFCIELNRLEDQVDTIVRDAEAELLNTETDAIRVIKLKEIYDYLEETADACEDVADILQNILVKNS